MTGWVDYVSPQGHWLGCTCLSAGHDGVDGLSKDHWTEPEGFRHLSRLWSAAVYGSGRTVVCQGRRATPAPMPIHPYFCEVKSRDPEWLLERDP